MGRRTLCGLAMAAAVALAAGSAAADATECFLSSAVTISEAAGVPEEYDFFRIVLEGVTVEDVTGACPEVAVHAVPGGVAADWATGPGERLPVSGPGEGVVRSCGLWLPAQPAAPGGLAFEWHDEVGIVYSVPDFVPRWELFEAPECIFRFRINILRQIRPCAVQSLRTAYCCQGRSR